MTRYILITYKDSNGEEVKTGIWSDSIENGVEKFLKLKTSITKDDIVKAGIYNRGLDEDLNALDVNKGEYAEVINYSEE